LTEVFGLECGDRWISKLMKIDAVGMRDRRSNDDKRILSQTFCRAFNSQNHNGR
jgi:hypothetical protein